MAKTLTLDLTFPGSPEAIGTLLRTQEFRESVCAAQRALAYDVTTSESAVDVTSTMSINGLPSFASKFVGDTVAIQWHETWTSPTTADLAITMPGKPGDITGKRTLVAGGDGTRQHVAMTAKVGIPLVGGKLEELILHIFSKGLTKEHKVAIAHLEA